VQVGCDLEAVPALARAPAYGAHRDGRGGCPGDVRAGEGRTRARVDDGAVPARDEDGLPGRRGARRSPVVLGYEAEGNPSTVIRSDSASAAVKPVVRILSKDPRIRHDHPRAN